jgi:hypothetical protein
VAVGHRGNSGPVVDALQQRACPIEIVRSCHDLNTPTHPRGQIAPGVDVRGELILQQHDALSRPHRQIGRGKAGAVARRGDERNLVGVGGDQLGKQAPCRLRVLKEVARAAMRQGVDLRAMAT